MEINPSRAPPGLLPRCVRVAVSGSAILCCFPLGRLLNTDVFRFWSGNPSGGGGGWKTGRQMLFSGITSVCSPGLGLRPRGWLFFGLSGLGFVGFEPSFRFLLSLRVL